MTMMSSRQHLGREQVYTKPNFWWVWFCRACTVAYATKSAVEKPLDPMEKEDVITSLQFTDRAAPIVLVMKGDGKTINQASKLDQ